MKMPEPVAYVKHKYLVWDKPGKLELYEAIYNARTVREVLEQAAQLMEQQHHSITNTSASALIRAMKEQIK